MKIIFFLLLSVITDIEKVLLSTAFEEKRNFCTLLYGGFAKVVFPMLKMGHFRECVKKRIFVSPQNPFSVSFSRRLEIFSQFNEAITIFN